jgi:pimeloyl-ACP methyl ester carboxylesterase
VTERVEGAGVELAWQETGAGSDVVFVHGVACGRQTWWDVIEALDGAVRAISYDRRGYGESGAPEPYTGTTVEEQAEDAAALIRSVAGGPVVLCAHSFGGVISTDLLLRHRDLVRAAVLLEPSLLSLSRVGAEAAGELREALTEGAKAGGAPGAVDALLRHFGGEGIFAVLGSERMELAHGSGVPLAADLQASARWSFTHGDLRSIEIPVVVVRGRRTVRAWGDAAESLVDHLPAGELRDADSGHFVPFEDPRAAAAAVVDLA